MRILNDLLKVARSARTPDWAGRCCTYTARVQEAVWERRPQKKFVSQKVIPILKKAQSAVVEVLENASQVDRPRLKKQAKNIGMRIGDMQDYIACGRCVRGPRGLMKRIRESKLGPKALLEEFVRKA